MLRRAAGIHLPRIDTPDVLEGGIGRIPEKKRRQIFRLVSHKQHIAHRLRR